MCYRDFNLQLKRKLPSLKEYPLYLPSLVWCANSYIILSELHKQFSFPMLQKINNILCFKFMLIAWIIIYPAWLQTSKSNFSFHWVVSKTLRLLTLIIHLQYQDIYIPVFAAAISLDAHARCLLFLTQIFIQLGERKLNNIILFWESFYPPAKFLI